MRSGRFQISRGHQLREGLGSAPRLLIVPREDPKPQPAFVPVAQLTAPSVPPPAAPVSPEYHAVHDRLTALERLARLRDEGALTAKEYAAEKAKLLRPPGDELVLRDSVPNGHARSGDSAPNGHTPLSRSQRRPETSEFPHLVGEALHVRVGLVRPHTRSELVLNFRDALA